MDRRLRFRHRARTSKSARATGLAGPSAAPEMPRRSVQAQAEAGRKPPGNRWRFGRAQPPRKAPGGKPRAPVPQTDTGGQVQAYQGARVSPR
jgi:hypothetical protein